MFVSLSSVINAIFDFAAFGSSRFLLRLGRGRGGWWPAAFGALDFAIAAALVTLLAIALLIAVEIFDGAAEVHAGAGARILPLQPLLSGLARTPGDAAYLWIWFTVDSSFLPSLLNLGIAALALAKELPQPNAWLREHVRELTHIRGVTSERLWNTRASLAALLAVQTLAGLALAVCTLGCLSRLVPKGLSRYGDVIRETVVTFVGFDMPGKLFEIVGAFLRHSLGTPP
jgi:hypothetical protein